MTKLVFVQLNEINFDVVQKYVQQGTLPAFKAVMRDFDRVDTVSEDSYAKLEPWIQWVSVQTGKRLEDHGVFRLGDIVSKPSPQIFEVLEQRGFRVGAISPMNACNALSHPAYFIPDPWTDTTSDASPFSKRLTRMLRQTVNENSEGVVAWSSKLTILEAALRTFRLPGSVQLAILVVKSMRKPWLRSLVLDQVVHLVHLWMIANRRPDISFVFLNAGAHVQHHYFLNSPHVLAARKNPEWYVPATADPVLDMLKAYDAVLNDYLSMIRKGWKVIIATGLSQVAYDRVKFYWRLRDHAGFLRRLGIEFKGVHPRMTRDFEIVFDSRDQLESAARVLRSVQMARDGAAVFGELDDRGRSLFVTLTYPDEIRHDDRIVYNGGHGSDFADDVVFVAVKNGMHSGAGYAYFSPNCLPDAPAGPIHVAGLFDLTLSVAGAAR